MTYLFLLGGLFLGWSFGRNNLSTVFGTAVGTRMLSFRLAATLTAIFIFLGGLLSSSATTSSVAQIGTISSLFGAFLVSSSIAVTILLSSYFGIPVSIVQSFIGALVAWNLFFHIPNNRETLYQMVGAWFYSPLLAALLAVFCFYLIRIFLTKVRIPLLYRDFWIRIFLILAGSYSAYFLGANNIPAIAGPYLNATALPTLYIIFGISTAIALGAFMADKKVISTVSSGLFPLSPVEALVVVLSCGITLYCFSSNALKELLLSFGLSTFPLVPIPTSNVLVGCVIGVGIMKKCSGIQWKSLFKVIASWILIPIISGLICWTFLAILLAEGLIL